MTASERGAERASDVSGKPSKADQVADVLRREIAVGIYPAGSDLPSEAKLSARFGVSRPSSREALRVLESEGLIRVTRGARGGARILPPKLDAISRYLGVYLQMRAVKLAEVYAAMQAFEPLAVRAIATRRDPAALGALAQCVAAQEFSTHDRDAFNRHEAEFRRLLMLHCGNEVIHMMGDLLADVYDLSMESLKPRVVSEEDQAQDFGASIRTKRKLVRLMADGETEKAEQLWSTYLAAYWRKVARHVGLDRKIDIYSGEAVIGEGPAPADEAPAGRKQARG